MSRRSVPTFGRYFCGHEISPYGLEHGYVDYRTLAKSFDAVLNNNIIGAGVAEDWEQVLGFCDEPDDCYREVFQWYIISDSGAEILKDYTNEILYYSESLDMYLWGVTHYGTSWDYVLTDIPCEQVNE